MKGIKTFIPSLALILMPLSGMPCEIAFVAGNEIRIMSLDGTDVRRIAIPGASFVGHPSFSPDGRWIAFECSLKPGTPTDIFRADIDGGKLENLTNTPAVWERCPSWSPDGRKIAFMAEMGIYILDLETGERRRISPRNSCDTYPSWSPDGRKITFESILPGPNAEIFMCDADGGNRIRLTRHPSPDQQPVFTPDGREVVFISRRDGPPGLFILNLSDRSVERLPVRGEIEAIWNPAVSPDGGMIAFKGHERLDPPGSWNIYVMDFPSGRGLRKLGEGNSPCWSPLPGVGLSSLPRIPALWGMIKAR